MSAHALAGTLARTQGLLMRESRAERGRLLQSATAELARVDARLGSCADSDVYVELVRQRGRLQRAVAGLSS